MKTLITLLLAACIFAGAACAQTLQGGAVTFAAPVVGAFEFILANGLFLPTSDGQDTFAGQPWNGFNYSGGAFHLYYKTLPSVCAVTCKFDGTVGEEFDLELDTHCTQISFPVTKGTLTVGIHVRNDVSALYSQTFCSVNGSMFMSGGSLIVFGGGL